MLEKLIANDWRDHDWGLKTCYDRDHNPPDMIVLSPGLYQHTCPSCGQQCQFTVPEINMAVDVR